MDLNPDVIIKGLATLASTLSITSSVVKLSEKGTTGSTAVSKYKEGATNRNRILLSNPDVAETVVSTAVIPRLLLRQLENETRQCMRRHITDRRNAASIPEKDKADINAAKCVCSVLRSIRRHNDGNLTGPILEDMWKAYSCPD